MSLDYISEKQNKHLSKIIAHGLNNGAIALSEMIGKEISIKEPVIEIISPESLPSVIGSEEETVTGIYLRFQEGHTVEDLTEVHGISGNILLIFSLDKAFEIASLLLGGLDYSTQDPKMIFNSALGEVGNVTGSAVLNTISDTIHKSLNPSPPFVITDMMGSILSSLAVNLSIENKQIVFIDTCFISENREIKAHLLILPDNKESIIGIANGLGADI